MKRTTAMSLFDRLEAATINVYSDEIDYGMLGTGSDIKEMEEAGDLPKGTGTVPAYSVRLDATVDTTTDEREYRIRVTLPDPPLAPDNPWTEVFAAADPLGVKVRIQNNGVELS